mmetsp:Transcript_43313/g.112478  ORF Transcript_43313/g.112478 Transcript_43313/m.112478 type:complete len:101 (+) Transcript_43313:851-1153(+)
MGVPAFKLPMFPVGEARRLLTTRVRVCTGSPAVVGGIGAGARPSARTAEEGKTLGRLEIAAIAVCWPEAGGKEESTSPTTGASGSPRPPHAGGDPKGSND